MMAAVIFSFGETVAVSAPINVFGKATAAAAMSESSKKRRRVGVSMVRGNTGRRFDFSPIPNSKAPAVYEYFNRASAKDGEWL